MAKASDNEFPSLLIKEGTAPASPAAGDQRLFIDSADHVPKLKNSSGSVATLGGGTSTLAADSDANISSPANHDFLQYQTSDSKWHNVPGGQYRFYQNVLSVAAASFSVPSIPAGYTSMILELEGRGDTSATLVAANLTFNSDAGANYDFAYIDANPSAAPTASVAIAQNAMSGVGILTAATALANVSGFARMVMPNYAGTTFHKNLQSDIAWKSDVTTPTFRLRRLNGSWRSTAAITSLTIAAAAGNFIAGTTLTVWLVD